MKTAFSRKLLHAVAVICAFSLSSVGLAAQDAAHDPMTEKIASARTQTDHQNIASWYESQIKAARDGAALHRKMRDAYQNSPQSYYYKASPHGSNAGFEKQCDQLIRQDEMKIKTYETLAKLHRDLAEKSSAQ